MPVFNLSKKQGVWFDYPGGGRIQLRAADPDDFIRINKESTENRPFLHEAEGQPPRVFNHEILDQDKLSRLFNDCTILAWEGFEDENGQVIPCTPEKKTELMRYKDDPTFRNFVNAKLTALDEAEKTKREQAEKNSLPSQSGEVA
jgi:hypothetical protein